MSPKQPTRLDTVDALRGLSILGVVFLHLTINMMYGPSGKTLFVPSWLNYHYTGLGFDGVPCFFAISGFLITFTSIRRFSSLARLSVASFYRIRFARIAPPLLLLLLLLSALHLLNIPAFRISPTTSTLPRALFAAFTFHFNWLSAHRSWFPKPWDVLWTLSVEEMFYLVFPLACGLLLRRKAGAVYFVTLLCALVVTGPLTRRCFYLSDPLWAYRSYFSNMDNVALGCLFAMLSVRLGCRSRALRPPSCYAMQLVGIGCIVFSMWQSPISRSSWLQPLQVEMGRTHTDSLLLGFGTCLIMLGSVLLPSQGSILTLPLRWFGRYSYEIYLSHEFVLYGLTVWLIRTQKNISFAIVCATVVVIGLLGYCLSRFFSEPMNRLLRGAPLPAQLKP